MTTRPETTVLDPLSQTVRPLWNEWLLANGVGGFAMGTVLGVLTRRYHGLLVASTRPPLGRSVCLSQIHETLTLHPGTPEQRSIILSPMHFRGAADRPWRDHHLLRFEKDIECRWYYGIPVGGGRHAELRRTIHLVDGRNAVIIRYEFDAPEDVAYSLALRPLVAMRDAHELVTDGARRRYTVRETPSGVIVASRACGVLLHSPQVPFRRDEQIWRSVDYIWEERRGMDHVEHLFSPGEMVTQTTGPTKLEIHASADMVDDAHALEASRRSRSKRLGQMLEHTRTRLRGEEPSHDLSRLVAAADAFIVHRGKLDDGRDGSTVIAGYPWFADWGRDTMISIPGLMLETGRHAEAFATLRTFARARRRGLIPNRFDDHNGEPHFNTVDASLWFIEACRAWLAATGDRAGFRQHLAPACLDIIDAYREGTAFDIRLDPNDGLITCGNPQTQLTWMDAQRDGVTFTPRFGKPVEINALWYNALRTIVELLGPDDRKLARELTKLADVARTSFRSHFILSNAKGLADRLEPAPRLGWQVVEEIRCNQIFAASLQHSPLEAPEARQVIQVVRDHLRTPEGLRTLSPTAPGYQPRFEGDLFTRDRAYHNGTVWPWLMGAYVDAVLRWSDDQPAAIAECEQLLRGMCYWLDGPAVGQLPEIFEAEPRADGLRHPDGCFAQAWSVAETLRASIRLTRARTQQTASAHPR